MSRGQWCGGMKEASCNSCEVFDQGENFYQELLARLYGAQRHISMSYLAFVDGIWANKLAAVLMDKARAGESFPMQDEPQMQF